MACSHISALGWNWVPRYTQHSHIGEAGTIIISAFVSPSLSDRTLARKAVGDGFHEIYLSADPATCEARDPKILYKKARSGFYPPKI